MPEHRWVFGSYGMRNPDWGLAAFIAIQTSHAYGKEIKGLALTA